MGWQELLEDAKLGKYTEAFQKAGVESREDMFMLTEEELKKDIGMTDFHIKKFNQAKDKWNAGGRQHRGTSALELEDAVIDIPSTGQEKKLTLQKSKPKKKRVSYYDIQQDGGYLLDYSDGIVINGRKYFLEPDTRCEKFRQWLLCGKQIDSYYADKETEVTFIVDQGCSLDPPGCATSVWPCSLVCVPKVTIVENYWGLANKQRRVVGKMAKKQLSLSECLLKCVCLLPQKRVNNISKLLAGPDPNAPKECCAPFELDHYQGVNTRFYMHNEKEPKFEMRHKANWRFTWQWLCLGDCCRDCIQNQLMCFIGPYNSCALCIQRLKFCLCAPKFVSYDQPIFTKGAPEPVGYLRQIYKNGILTGVVVDVPSASRDEKYLLLGLTYGM
eukprot:g2831.t1